MKRKAFVKGVSVLDSNPDAYKYVKKKYKMRSAQQGTKLELGENLTDEQLKNIEGVWNYLTQTKGVSPRNAAAIMGNVWQESRFLPQRVSSAGATGWMQFLGQRDKDYQKWLKTNEHHSDYGQFDYILYAIQDPEHKHDFYRNDYERVVNSMKKFKEQGNNKAYNEYNTYKNKIYGAREKEGRLHFFNDVNTAFNDPKYKLNDLTTLWHDSIERSNPAEANIPTRIKAANVFYNYYNPKPNPLDLPNLYSGSIQYQMKFGGTIKAQNGTKLTGWQKVGNFLNSDYGNLILNGVQQGLSYFSNKPKSTKANKEAFIKNYEANALNNWQSNTDYMGMQTTQEGAHASTLFADYMKNKEKQQVIAKAQNDAKAAFAQDQTMQNSGQQSSNNLFGSVSNIIGGIGQFIGPKQTDGQTEIATTPEKAIQTTASPSLDGRVTNPSIASLTSLTNGESFSDWRNRQIKQQLDLEWELMTGAPKGWTPEEYGLYTGKLKFR